MREFLRLPVLCLPLLVGSCLAQPCVIGICGDADLSGSIDILDGLETAKAAAGMVVLSSQAFSSANVHGALEPDPGATIGIVDALTIARYVVGIGSLTCCTQFNDPPTCAITAPVGGSFPGDVAVEFTATDGDGDPLTLTFEYSDDGGVTWMTTTAAGGSPLSSPAAGIGPGSLTFVWDSVTDVPLSGGMGVPPPLSADILVVNDYPGGIQHYSIAVAQLGYTETLISNNPPGSIATELAAGS